MKLPGLVELSLILMLASKGQSWRINVTRKITAPLGSNVTINCMFTYPPKYYTENVEVYWKKPERMNYTYDKDPDAYVFHPNVTLVNEKYRGKTHLIGDKANGDCSLKIYNLMNEVSKIYVRVITKGEQYSFRRDFVSISGVTSGTLKPDAIPQPLPTFEETTTIVVFSTVGPQENSISMYIAIFVPVAALLIIILVAGIVLFLKHKRSQPLTREESGYYANVSRMSSNQAKRKASCKTQEDKKLPELKAIDEPVYINLEAPPDQLDQRMDHTDDTYANVDYSK